MGDGIELIAIDFDRTFVSVHTMGQWKKSARALAKSAREVLRLVLQAAREVDLMVAIVTFSSQAELVAEVVSIALEGKVENVYRKSHARSKKNAYHQQSEKLS